MSLIFVVKFLETYIVRTGTYTTLTKKENLAMTLDGADELLGVLAFMPLMASYVRGEGLAYILKIAVYVLGSMIATKLVAKRWPKFIWKMIQKKRKYFRKTPFTNA